MQFRCEQLIVIVWRAKSEKTPVITMVSSAFSAGMTQVDNRKGEVLQKPVVVDTYNHSMNGVDRSDQHCTYYSLCERLSNGGGNVLLPP